VLTMHFDLPEAKYRESVPRMNFFEDLLERVRTLPGVEAAGLARMVPGEGYGGDAGFAVREHPPLPQGQSQYAIVRWADPGYFPALGIPFLKGKTFDDDQRLEKVNQVIVSQSFARQYLPGEDAIGKHLVFLGGRAFTIVGVVGDTRIRAAEAPPPILYCPLYILFNDGVPTSATLAVRSNQDASSLALPIQRMVQQLDRDLAISDILTMDQIVGKSALDSSFDATLLAAFASLSLLLASTGLFGVLSYVIAKRTAEIGIRIALGARRQDVFRILLLAGLRPAFLGLAIGSLGGLAAAQLIRSMLYGTDPADPTVFVSVMAVLLFVAAAACVAPAWRAARLEPMTALRLE